jgi:transcription-repair coupling factor (superfamily II helicase)
LPVLKKGVVLTTVSTLLHRLAPVEYVLGSSLSLDSGQKLDIGELRTQLSRSAYASVSQVMEPGEYSVRGGLIDLYPVGSPVPYRLDLFDDRIESIRVFDPATQRSGDKIPRVRLLPAREFAQTESAIQLFRRKFRARFEGDPQRVSLYRDVSAGLAPPGAEYYLPLFFETTATIFDYLPASVLVINEQSALDAARGFHREAHERYAELSRQADRPILTPDELFIAPEVFERASANYSHVLLVDTPETHRAGRTTSFALPTPPQFPFEHRAAQPYQALFTFLQNFKGRCLIVAETPGRRETLQGLLFDHGLRPADVTAWDDFLNGSQTLGLTLGALERGLSLTSPLITVITEPMLYGERATQRRRRERAARDPTAVFKNLTQLKVGDAVVHEEHGVGRYLGLATLDAGDGNTEFLALEYLGGDKLYIPVLSLHLVSRYTGTDPEHPPLHRLGSDTWQKAREKAAEKAFDAAAELLEVQALRQARVGHAFGKRDEAYMAFADNFPFEETPDQLRAIEEVLRDMETAKPMDRLVCGDVGFGKTEVAIRAAFLAVHGKKQVAVLVPTTLLAQQHFENFHNRFAGLGVKLELLSRFRTKTEEKKAIEGLEQGSIDIVIGTHRLLQDDVRFKNLGLVVLDEEHRFGVRQKERLKKLRSEVDVLTLTATPIPRTLNLALSGMRDISLIGQAPPGRLSIKTFVGESHTGVIREAILREIRRGGQVYYLHNEVRTIERATQTLRELLPEAEIRIAHGQMPERDLEQVMLDFYHQRFHVLVCSTIIESGIDVPTANTIVIERADKFGLAQLHQLRGRVGRSHHRAYAYLLIPGGNAISADARKRLEALASLEDLGAGFALASHDLEIRGAGELLGESQSGAIDEVGFSLYAELLERAVAAIKSGQMKPVYTAPDTGTEINLHAPTRLPEDYVSDVALRLMLYKRIAGAQTPEELQGLQEELIDRFGRLPETGQLLFKATALKLQASPLGIRKIEVGPKGARLEFAAKPNIDPGLIIKLMQSQPKVYRLDGPTRLRLTQEMPEVHDRIRVIEALLVKLGADDETAARLALVKV